MDRRKLKSSNTLHKHLFSASQTSSFSRAVSSQSLKENIERSVSENVNSSRKRKNSEDEQEDEPSNIASPVKFANVTKRRRNVIEDDEEDDVNKNSDSEETSSKHSKDSNDDKFTKPAASRDPRKKKSNAVNRDEDNEQSGSEGSYVLGLLETLDKSPSKLSQNSTSSVEKYRKVDLRAPIGHKNKKTLSKIMSERRNDKGKQNKSTNSQLKKTTANNVNDKTVSRRNLTPSMPKLVSDCSDVNDEDMSFSDSDTSSVKNVAKSNKNKTLCPPSPKRKTPAKSTREKSPAKTSPERERVLESPNLSPVKLQSPEKKNETTRKKKTQISTNDKFINFTIMAGINLATGENLHIANNDPREVIQKMKELINTGDLPLDEIIHCWNSYIDDEENLKKSLEEMKIETDEGVAICSKAISLSRLLLQVPQLQTEIMNSLIRKLIDKIIATDSSDDAPWALQMLQQFRFLELIVDPELLISKLEELLSSSPEWFQRDIIVFIPDIVTDNLHRTTAEMLTKIMENNGDLTNIILDCIHNLILGKDYKEELREKVLGLLDKHFEKKTVPAITKFVLSGCATEAIALKSLKVLRSVDMIPTSKEKQDEIYTDQMFMVNAIKMSIELNKEVSQAAVTLIKNTSSEAVPLDIIVLILLYDTTSAKKKIVESTLYTHIKDSHYKTNLLYTFYTGYKEVARILQNTALNLAVSLLRADSATQVEFGIEWIRKIFISQSETTYKQREVLEKLLNLMGSKDKTVKNALEVLSRMTNDEKERQFLQQHTCFLRIFLEKIDNLNFEEVSLLYHILHGLCTQSETIANILNDDLSIIMQKQLCSSKVLSKCKGVLGAVMAIKHLAGKEETKDLAFTQLKKTHKSIRGCPRSEGLFYDQLANVISTTKYIDDDFLTQVTNYFEDQFTSNGLTENKPNGLVQKYRLNDDTSNKDCINFASIKSGASLPVLFKLLCICTLKKSGSLEDINALLGFGIFMPEDFDMPEPTTADLMIHCINWFRETISGFVTEKVDIIREQLFKRLESLMSLQGEYVSMVAMLESRYQPPPCYFHYFPVPQFHRIETKSGKKKKGKKTKKQSKKDKDKDEEDDDLLDLTLNNSIISLPEWESWESGSELTFKNPAYFRQMNTNIIYLLESNLNTHTTQSTHESITIPQVCFILKELLHMINQHPSESFIHDLIQLLPKICVKLQKVISDLRKKENTPEKEAVRLILCLLIKLFSWKEFQNARHYNLLREGLRALASMMSESSASLRSCKDLVAEAYKYFESLEDIASQISLAVALVNMCSCLMELSNSFKENNREQIAKTAHGFLCLEWNNETQGPPYKAAIKELLKTWIDNEPNPLKTVTSTLEWLPEQAALLERPNSRLGRMRSITKANFYLLLKQLFVGLVKGIDISLQSAESDPERIRIWSDAATCLDKISIICKSNKNMTYLALFLRYTSTLYQNLLTNGMKILEANIKYETEEVLKVIKLFQTSGRFLRDIFCTARKEKNVCLLKLIPTAKSRRERFIYRVKGMLTANNSIQAFWMGNLLNKDLDGEEIASESSEDIMAGSDMVTESSTANDSDSEIFHSDSDDNEEDEE